MSIEELETYTIEGRVVKLEDVIHVMLEQIKARMVQHRILKVFFVTFLLLGWGTYSIASSVLQVTFSDLCVSSAFIFEGRVVAVHAHQDSTTQLIWTKVTFAIIDPIQGGPLGDTIGLEFLGGSVGDLTLDVTHMRVPNLGERGIYFVETLSRRQVHPFSGWSQGHFIVEAEPNAMARIATADHRPIFAIEEVSSETLRSTSANRSAGVRVDPPAGALAGAMDVETFKQHIRAALSRASQNFGR